MEMLGLVTLTNGDKVFLGFEIKLAGANHIRQLVGYRPTLYPVIMTSNMCKGVCYPNLEPTVCRIVRNVDV